VVVSEVVIGAAGLASVELGIPCSGWAWASGWGHYLLVCWLEGWATS
jgi:hypothetical protein